MASKNDIQLIPPEINMVTLSMKGPLELTNEKIDEVITARSPGNYTLGYIEGHSFIVEHIGRSDTDLNGRLKEWVLHYPNFKWSYARSEKAAYEKECRNYHDFGRAEMLGNVIHPAKPDGTKLKCVVCGK